MKKHIKVRAKLHKDEKHFDLEVLEMSHRRDMGNHKVGENSAFLFEGIALAFNTSSAHSDSEFSIGTWKFKESCDLILVIVKGQAVTNIETKWWPRIKAAIQAYNEYEFEE